MVRGVARVAGGPTAHLVPLAGGPTGSAAHDWRSIAGGSAWRYDAASGEHYLHTFLPEQPDLNWRNADVRAAVAEAMRFWLARGVDGFRVDALPLLVKDARFRDNPPDPRWRPGQSDYRRLMPAHTVDQPEMAEVAAFLRAVVDEYPERVLFAEMGLPPARAERYYDAIHVPFNFGLITEQWTAPRLAHRIAAHLEALPAGRRTGCWATTTFTAWRRGSGTPARASRSVSPCRER